MKAVRDLLVAAIDEQRPMVLIMGQDAWADRASEDSVLAKALDRLGRNSERRRGWAGLLGTTRLPTSFYEWLAERFERRVHPAWLSVLGELPWSAVFTSALDPTLSTLIRGPGREPEVVLTANETPRAVRSKARPPLYHLFGCAGSLDHLSRPPADRSELRTRRIRHALPILNRTLDTATTLGLVIVDGFDPNRDWIKIGDILGAIGSSAPEQILWFGGRPPGLGEEDAADFDAALLSRRIMVENDRLGTVASELLAIGRLADFAPPESQETGIVSFTNGRFLETAPEERLRVEAVASIVDDAWTAFLPPLGQDAVYDAFRRFHGDFGGPRFLVEGVRRGFSFERDFEKPLLRLVTKALADHANFDAPVVVHGQSGTGKSVALARIVAEVRKTKTAAVLYAVGRIPQPHDITSFCEEAEKSGAEATLIVCDANRDVDPYRDLLMSMRSQGRRVVVIGSRYRMTDDPRSQTRFNVEAPSGLSRIEREKFASLIAHFSPEHPNADDLSSVHMLAFFYRSLPPSRAHIALGLGAEARAAEQELRTRGREVGSPVPDTLLAHRLVEAGLSSDYFPLFNDDEIDALEAGDAAGRIIDLVMVAGRLNCDVPVNLLLRAVTDGVPGADTALIAKMFGELDLFRWKWADHEQNELLIMPRLVLEAELICRRRLGGPEKEAERLIELIRAAQSTVIEVHHERRFLFNLLQQIGDNGPTGSRYRNAYVQIARALTELRRRFGVVDPRLMLQESAFRRAAVRSDVVNDDERLPLLEEARDAVQAALDGIDDGSIFAARRTRKNLQGERASLYGFLAYDRASRAASSAEIWSSYEAARVAIREAVSVTDNYYPLDVGLWTPADMLKKANLTDEQRAEIRADIYATLDQVDPDMLSPKQREKYYARRMMVGNVLQSSRLTEAAYASLERNGSTAGYFLRAREFAPKLGRDTIQVDDPRDLSGASKAADFLRSRFARIEQDGRCLSLLLECSWIVAMRQRPLRGQRQPLPADRGVQREILAVVRALNHASGNAARPVTRYLEAVLAWVTGDEQDAIQMFRELGQETEYEDPGRVVRRHRITDEEGRVRGFAGRVERQRSEGHWVVRVDGLKQTIDLLSRDFRHEEIAYGRSLKRFAVAFNFIGPIADPLVPRR